MSQLLRSLRSRFSGATALAVAPFPAWALFRIASGSARWEHLLLLVLPPLLVFYSIATRRLFFGLLPFAWLGLVYDSMGSVKEVGLSESRVHVCDLAALDARLFGVRHAGRLFPIHDWLQQHAKLWLDLVCAVPYGTFLYVSIAFAVYLYFRDYERMRRFGMTFLVVNLLGFVTYHVYPAAPPWYFHAHGCSVDLHAAASEGPNLARVDEWLGFRYFGSFYGRSNDVFGAVPSLHVTYPLLVALYGYRMFGQALRTASIAYFALMCFSAVYLDHHWVFDVLMGIGYVLVVEGAQAALRLVPSTLRRNVSLARTP